ncbi:MAG: ABC transporter substrate-binding protein, partial [Desulfuromonadales bacterium]|nr:ABC transporter substrate-binding protein [Desulfuromonadales bacterium]NIS42260.1 ABC transporter substrate-binding protein [Desulfuromonadales bacterium]
VTEAVFTPVGQDATRVAALIAGDVDMAYPVPVQDWERLEKADGVSPLTGPEART